jgi:hypothetical protein
VILRRHEAAGTRSWAVYSDCETYRYALTRIWQPEAPRLAFVMLNPSTASEMRNDPTVARCEGRARALGHGGFRVVNLFAFRATDPRTLVAATDPCGPAADAALAEAADWADALLCAWGNHGAFRQRDRVALALLRAGGKPILHLGFTRQGQPRHPLYVATAQLPQVWDQAASS